MVNVKEDLTGRRFGRLTVICQAEDYVSKKGKHYAQWLCECDCDEHNQLIVIGTCLKSGHTRSCGCIRNEIVAQRGRDMFTKRNEYILNIQDEYGLYGIGYCSNTGKEFYFDMDDYDKIKDYCWVEHKMKDKNYYALEAKDVKSNKIIRMHYLITDKYYDHIDRNTFNNRKNNLRYATNAENVRNKNVPTNNTSGIIGVSWYKKSSKWASYITVNNKCIYLGRYINKEDAIKIRLEAEAKYFGEFAPQRHLFEEYGIKV